MPRLLGHGQHRIDYRHVIWSLVRKPGAFAHYRYRDDLFPSLAFRRAYDALCASRPQRADREYVRLLHLAASTSESEVEPSPWSCCWTSGSCRRFDAVRDLVREPVAARLPDLGPVVLDLGVYDRLLVTGRRPPCLTATSGRRARPRPAQHAAPPAPPGMADAFADLALKAAKANLTHEAFLTRWSAASASSASSAASPACCGSPGCRPRRPSTPCSSTASRRSSSSRSSSCARARSSATPSTSSPSASPGWARATCWRPSAHELILQGQAVLWTPTATLVQRLLAAKRDLRLPAGAEAPRPLRLPGPRRHRLRPARPRRDGGALHPAGRALRAAQRGHLHQPGLLRVGAHLQGPDDDAGGHRPRRAPLGHPRPASAWTATARRKRPPSTPAPGPAGGPRDVPAASLPRARAPDQHGRPAAHRAARA